MKTPVESYLDSLQVDLFRFPFSIGVALGGGWVVSGMSVLPFYEGQKQASHKQYYMLPSTKEDTYFMP